MLEEGLIPAAGAVMRTCPATIDVPKLISEIGGKSIPNVGTQIRYATLAVCGLLLLAVGLVFGQTVHYDFVNLDDDRCVYANPQVTQGLTASGIVWALTHRKGGAGWAPLTWISHMLVWQFYGANAGAHHLTNVLLHGTTAVLLFLVLRSMTGRLWPSALAAALFAIHPLRVESVAWVTERKDVLSGLFFMLAVGTYVWYVRHPFSLRRYLLLMVCFGLGLMAKAMLVTLPLALLLLDYWPLGRMFPAATEETSLAEGRRKSRFTVPVRLLLEKLPLLAMSAVCSLQSLWTEAELEVVAPEDHVALGWRIGNALVSYVTYIGQTFCPVRLTVMYPHPGANLPIWKIVAATLVLACISLGTLASWRRRPYLLVGWLWYLGILLPASGLVEFGTGIHAMADRFTYLPQIGLCLALAWGAADVCRSWSCRRAACGVVSALVLMVLMGCAWRQTSFWRDSETLWTHTLACTPRHRLARSFLGRALAAQGRLDEALTLCQRDVELQPDDAVAHCNLGSALAQRGRLEEAVAQYRKSLELQPNAAATHYGLGATLAMQGRLDEALSQYRKVLQIDPNSAESYYGLGAALAMQGRLDEAMAHYQRALQIDPNSAEAHDGAGRILAARGRLDEARAHYQRAVELQPNNATVHGNFGNVLAAQGRLDEAMEHYQRALALQPNFALAHNNLAKILAARGQFPAALAHYRKALEIQPGDPMLARSLAWLLATCPVASLRNGDEALTLAERANRLSGGNRPNVLDALAAAYAEAGWFPEALATARKALELATQQNEPALANALRARIALYEAGKPFHQTMPAPQPSPLRQ